jgi:hypothetical protein
MSGFGTIGSLHAPPQLSAEEVRESRCADARRNARWTEIDGSKIVERGRYALSDGTHEYRPYRGAAFVGGRLMFADQMPLHFYVDSAGDVVLLERVRTGVA